MTGERTRRAAIVAAATLLALALGASRASAQTDLYYDEYGAGVRSAAMGQAFTGIADDASATYHNPAGLAYAPVQTAIGWRYVKARLEYSTTCLKVAPIACPGVTLDQAAGLGDTHDVSVFYDVPSTRGIQVNIVSDLDYDALNEKLPWLEPLTLGVNVFLALDELSSFRTFNDKGEPYFFRYDTRPALITLGFGLGYDITDWFAVGFSILPTLNAFQSSSNEVALPPEFIPGVDPVDPNKPTDLTITESGEVTLVPVAGVLIKPPFAGLQDLLSLGVTYRGEFEAFFGTGPAAQAFGVRIDGEFVPFLELPDAEVSNFVGFNPEQIAIGLGIRPMERLVLGLDATWKHWRPFRVFGARRPEPNFENTWTFRVGGEYTIPLHLDVALPATIVDGLVLRAGYYLEPTPVSDAGLAGRFNILDSDQHVVSGGIGISTEILERFGARLDVVFQAHLLEDRSTDNAQDPRFGPLEMSGTVYSTGFELNFNL